MKQSSKKYINSKNIYCLYYKLPNGVHMFLKGNSENPNIKNPPSDDAYPIISSLFINKRFNDYEITINSLSLTILELISQNQIRCEITRDESYKVGSKLTTDDLDVMKNITLRIASSGELKTSQTKAINLLKKMNKTKKFNFKDMLKFSGKTAIANAFLQDYSEFKNAVESENNYADKNYRDILVNSKLTPEGKELKKQWKNYQDYLISKKLTEKYPPESIEENDAQLIYGACFDIERDAFDLRKNNTELSNFIDKDGYKFLNIIFNNAVSNVSQKRRGNGIFYGVNDKYTIPGGG